jgi:hypothetical protein
VNWAKPPPDKSNKTVTSDPSGANTSGADGIRLVAKSLPTFGHFNGWRRSHTKRLDVMCRWSGHVRAGSVDRVTPPAL